MMLELTPIHVGESFTFGDLYFVEITHKRKDETPYELWNGRKPSYKSIDCIFIGYAINHI